MAFIGKGFSIKILMLLVSGLLDHRRKKLELLERVDDPEASMVQLNDKVAELLAERCKNALDFKVN